jgi:hypothetical protein
MKLLIGLLLGWTTLHASAQFLMIFPESNRVDNVLTGLPVEANEGIVASFYWAPDDATHESQLMPLGSPFPVGFPAAGLMLSPTVTPPVDIYRQRIHVQLRIWELRFGNTFEQAEANRISQNGRLALVGRSKILANVLVRQNSNFLPFDQILLRPVTTNNQCAQAVPGHFTTLADQPVNVALLGSDTSRSPLTYQITASPTQGALIGTPPNLIYTPQSGFCGRDLFAFSVTDGDSACFATNASVEIEVCPAHGSGDIIAYTQVRITNSVTGQAVTDADGIVGQLYWAPVAVFDERLFEPVGNPTPTIMGFFLGDAVRAPVTPSGADANFQVRFWESAFGATYEEAINNRQARNGRLTLVGSTEIKRNKTGDPEADPPSPPALIEFMEATILAPAPPVPQASPQAVITGLSQSVAIELAADGPGQSFLYALTTYPVYGELSGIPPNLTYTPRAGFSGVDSFMFVVCERGRSVCAPEPAMVTITVDKVALCPIAVVRVLPPAVKDAAEETYWIIAPNRKRTLVLFEGSGSFPRSASLAFSWTMLPETGGTPAPEPVQRPTLDSRATSPRSPAATADANLASSRRAARLVPLQDEVLFGLGEVAGWPAPVGVHWVRLDVSDENCSSSQTVTLRVLTPVGGILRCMSLIEKTTAPATIKGSLLAVLKSAAHSMDQGQTLLARHRLSAFLIILHRYGPNQLDPAIAERWANSVQWALASLGDDE